MTVCLTGGFQVVLHEQVIPQQFPALHVRFPLTCPWTGGRSSRQSVRLLLYCAALCWP